MPRLSRELVEHRLPIKASFRPYKLGARNFKLEIIQPCCYADWVSNIIPVEKKNMGKIRICVDIRNLNRATPKDEYPMPVADLLIDTALGNKVISFLDGNAGYKQIFTVKEDVSKTEFRCPGFIDLFEWLVMTFGLKNASATYQSAMNLTFHDLLGVMMDVYIDEVVVKSVGFEEHMTDLKLSLERMRKYGLRMNPLKCTFGVTSGRLLGFIVHEHSIQIDPKKIESIRKMGEPVCKKDVQKLLGKINYLRCFISNLAGQVEPWLPLIQLKHEKGFTWGGRTARSFPEDQRIPHVSTHVASSKGREPIEDVYCHARTGYWSCSTTRRRWQGISGRIRDAKTQYVFMEKLYLSLYYACSKFRHYILSSSCIVACQYDVIKLMLLKPVISGRIGK
jgi:hypothetical protein